MEFQIYPKLGELSESEILSPIEFCFSESTNPVYCLVSRRVSVLETNPFCIISPIPYIASHHLVFKDHVLFQLFTERQRAHFKACVELSYHSFLPNVVQPA
jgi:hypothetical protein